VDPRNCPGPEDRNLPSLGQTQADPLSGISSGTKSVPLKILSLKNLQKREIIGVSDLNIFGYLRKLRKNGFFEENVQHIEARLVTTSTNKHR